MSLTPDNPINQIPKPKWEGNKLVSPKLTTPAQVRDIYQADWDSDVDNRLNRAWVQGMLEGKPIYNPQRMKEAGLGGCCNIDWRHGQMAIRKKMEPYITALQSLPVFLNIRTRFGTQQDQVNWGRLISQAHAKLMRSWASFPFRYQYCILYLASHGSSFCYFNDDTDWRWHVGTLGDMVVPRMALADAEEFDRISTNRDFTPSFLYSQIKEALENGWEWTRNETKDGWHVPTVKLAIADAQYKDFFRSNDFERAEVLWKSKEVVYSQSSKIVPSILMWNKEDDEGVTQYIATKTALEMPKGQKKEEFLYKRVKHFQSMRQGVVTFTRDIGTNGFFHSIRGTGSDIFPISQELNKLKCGAFDAMKLEMSIPIRATDDVWNSDMGYVQAGPFWFLREGMEIEDRHAKDFSKTVFPGLQMLQNDLAEQSGASKYPDQPGSKIDMQELLNNLSGIDVMENFLFSISWERLLRESLRRLVNIKHQNQAGGKEAMAFRLECKKLGVPDEAINQIEIEDCVATRAIGNGSPQARIYTMESMKDVVPFMDEQGRNAWVRDKIASLPGVDWTVVDRYAPQEMDMRPTQQVRNAIFENDILMRGGTVPVLPNDDHLTHLEQHGPAMEQVIQQVEEGMLGMADASSQLYPLYIHSTEHADLAYENPIMKDRIAKFRQSLHNVGEIIVNGQREAQAMEKKRQENAVKGLDENGNPLPGQEGEGGGERRIFPDPTGSGNLLSASELSMVARTQVHLSDAARNASNAQAIHDMKVAQMREDLAAKQVTSADRAATGRQKRQINDLKAAVQFTTK